MVGDFELLDGVKNGVLEAMNSFTPVLGGQAAGDRVPVVVPDGPALSARVGHLLLQQGRPEGGSRDLRQARALCYVDRIHHGPNIIHSKKPIRTIEDFKDLKLRVPAA